MVLGPGRQVRWPSCCKAGSCLSLKSSCDDDDDDDMGMFSPTHLFPDCLRTRHNSEFQARLGYKVGSYLNKTKKAWKGIKQQKPKAAAHTSTPTSVDPPDKGAEDTKDGRTARSIVTVPLSSFNHPGACWTKGASMRVDWLLSLVTHKPRQMC